MVGINVCEITREVVADSEGASVEVIIVAPGGMVAVLEVADVDIKVAPEADAGIDFCVAEIGAPATTEHTRGTDMGVASTAVIGVVVAMVRERPGKAG